jgi:anti-anti-sigma factor
MERDSIRLRVDVTGPVAKVGLGGEIDDSNVEEVASTLRDLCAPPVERIELDLGEVDYLGSAGVRALVRAADNGRGIRVAVVQASQIVLRVLELTGLLSRLSPEPCQP